MNDVSKNNLRFWWPRLQESGVCVPRTSIIETDLNLLSVLDGKLPKGWETFTGLLSTAAAAMGYPCFLRTGYGSGKQEWHETCFVQSPENLGSHVTALIDWSYSVDMLGLPTDTWVVREYLPLRSAFTAFGGMPVTVERRYFIDGGGIVCHHPYWPADSIRRPSVPDYQERLHAMNEPQAGEEKVLKELSLRVARQFGDAWSLDWALANDGSWYAIDMAQAARSYHWPDCPIAKSRGWDA